MRRQSAELYPSCHILRQSSTRRELIVTTRTATFGVGKREGHDASPFYDRGLVRVTETDAHLVTVPASVDELFVQSART